MSWIWASILQGRDFLKNHGRWIVGDGRSIKLWRDKWLPSNFITNANPIDENALVESLIDHKNKQWDVLRLRQQLPPPKWLFKPFRFLSFSIMGMTNKFIWPHTRGGCYLVKSDYHLAYNNS